jgi:hypothetical protein
MARRNDISEELQAKAAQVAQAALRRLEELAKTDPKAAAALEKARKKGIIPDA